VNTSAVKDSGEVLKSFADQLGRYKSRVPHALLLTSRRFGASSNETARDESQGSEGSDGEDTPDESLSAAEIALIGHHLCGFKFGVDPIADTTITPGNLRHPDFLLLDTKRRNLRLEEIEPIFSRICYPPMHGQKRLIIIERAQRLLPHASNALLKSIEEPRAATLFVLTAPSVAHVMPTIASRCMRMQAPMLSMPGSPLNAMEEADAMFLRAIVGRIANLSASAVLRTDFAMPQNNAAASELSSEFGRIETLGKNTPSENLIAALLALIVEWRKRHPSDTPQPGLQWLLKRLRAWQQSKEYNPNSTMRLCELIICSSGR
jgi:hypothetical protein